MGAKLMGTHIETVVRSDRIDLEITIDGSKTLTMSGSVEEIRKLVSLLNRAIRASGELNETPAHRHNDDVK